jgi:hypothetical protein
MRKLIILAVCCGLTACDPIRFAAIQVAPRPAGHADSTALAEVFAIAERVARGQSLRPVAVEYDRTESWLACYGQNTTFLCWKAKDGEAQFRIRSAGFTLSPEGQAVRRALLETFRARFDSLRVRECEWCLESDRPSGCAPVAPPDSGSSPSVELRSNLSWPS